MIPKKDVLQNTKHKAHNQASKYQPLIPHRMIDINQSFPVAYTSKLCISQIFQ
jgi:hypothetical protein